MRVHESRLLIRAARRADFPRAGIPEVAFAGRSNVGKSSLLNALVGQRGLARISSKPGCTRLLHFYLLNRSLIFADLPGYGFARAPEEVRAGWRPLVESYLVGRKPLRLVWLLLDARHGPTDLDTQLLEWLAGEGIPFRAALTKTDKLSGNGRVVSLRRCAEALGPFSGTHAPVPTSARSGRGLPAIWREITRCIGSERPLASGDDARGPAPGDAALSGG